MLLESKSSQERMNQRRRVRCSSQERRRGPLVFIGYILNQCIITLFCRSSKYQPPAHKIDQLSTTRHLLNKHALAYPVHCYHFIVIKLTMELKYSDNQPTSPLPPQSQQNIKAHQTQFLKKIRYFLQAVKSIAPPVVIRIRGGHGFLLIDQFHSPETLNKLIQQYFQLNIKQFLRTAKQFGFKIRSKVAQSGVYSATTLVYKQTIIQPSQNSGDVQAQEYDQCSQEEQDQFPRDEEVQYVMRQKQQKSKIGFVKPSSVFNKAMSQGNSGIPQWRKNDDASIEVKLYEQDLQSPDTIQKQSIIKQQNSMKNDGEVSSLIDKTLVQKQNYQKCSKLIDGTIIELLQAHRNNRLQQKKDNLMEKIVEIYDMLSDSNQNIASVGRLFNSKDSKKEESSNIISGFKSAIER